MSDVFEENRINPTVRNKYKTIIEFIKKMKNTFMKNLKETGIGIKELFTAMIQRDFYSLLVALKFNLAQIMKAIGAGQKLVANGILAVLNKVVKSDLFFMLEKKLIKIDAIIAKYPILKKLTGVALAGLLIFMWLRMTFIGDFSFDFDLSIAFDALSGQYTIKDLLGTPSGLQFLSLFFLGQFAGISFDWVLATPILVVIMLVYTSSKRNPAIQRKAKAWIKKKSRKIGMKQLVEKRV